MWEREGGMEREWERERKKQRLDSEVETETVTERQWQSLHQLNCYLLVRFETSTAQSQLFLSQFLRASLSDSGMLFNSFMLIESVKWYKLGNLWMRNWGTPGRVSGHNLVKMGFRISRSTFTRLLHVFHIFTLLHSLTQHVLYSLTQNVLYSRTSYPTFVKLHSNLQT